MKKKGKPPSRVRYESSHPTISCRVSKEMYDQLTDTRMDGMSFADILKTGLGILKPKLQNIFEARRDSYKAGYREGYRDAQQHYKVTYPCSVCNQIIELTSDNEKRFAGKYMREHGWVHAACLNRNR
jgi:hypothetical protein